MQQFPEIKEDCMSNLPSLNPNAFSTGTLNGQVVNIFRCDDTTYQSYQSNKSAYNSQGDYCSQDPVFQPATQSSNTPTTDAKSTFIAGLGQPNANGQYNCTADQNLIVDQHPEYGVSCVVQDMKFVGQVIVNNTGANIFDCDAKAYATYTADKAGYNKVGMYCMQDPLAPKLQTQTTNNGQTQSGSTAGNSTSANITSNQPLTKPWHTGDDNYYSPKMQQQNPQNQSQPINPYCIPNHWQPMMLTNDTTQCNNQSSSSTQAHPSSYVQLGSAPLQHLNYNKYEDKPYIDIEGISVITIVAIIIIAALIGVVWKRQRLKTDYGRD